MILFSILQFLNLLQTLTNVFVALAFQFGRSEPSTRKTLQNDFETHRNSSIRQFLRRSSDLTHFPCGTRSPSPKQIGARLANTERRIPGTKENKYQYLERNRNPRAMQAITEFEMQTAGHREDEQSSQVVVTITPPPRTRLATPG